MTEPTDESPLAWAQRFSTGPNGPTNAVRTAWGMLSIARAHPDRFEHLSNPVACWTARLKAAKALALAQGVTIE